MSTAIVIINNTFYTVTRSKHVSYIKLSIQKAWLRMLELQLAGSTALWNILRCASFSLSVRYSAEDTSYLAFNL